MTVTLLAGAGLATALAFRSAFLRAAAARLLGLRRLRSGCGGSHWLRGARASRERDSAQGAHSDTFHSSLQIKETDTLKYSATIVRGQYLC